MKLYFALGSIRVVNHGWQQLLGFQFPVQTQDIEGFIALQLQGLARIPWHELQGQNPHTNQVGAVYTFEALNYDGFHTQ